MTCGELNSGERPSDAWLDEHRDLLQPDLLALDLGCGTGEDSYDLLALGLRVIALDRSMHRLRRAHELAAAARFVRADITRDMPFAADTFDIVVASLSIHYFDWATTVRIAGEIARILRPGGWLICRVNRVGDVNFEYGCGPEIEPEYFEVRPGHRKRYFTETTLRELLEPCFTIDAISARGSRRWGAEKRTLVARAQRRA
jgi:SAM-dependent methyltransferase